MTVQLHTKTVIDFVIDFGLTVTWNFFATSHNKNVCDGIGETIKRRAPLASLQRPITNRIMTPPQFFNFCNKKYFCFLRRHFSTTNFV